MKGKHLPYALLALTIFGLFIVLPLILLIFSSFHCVRTCFGQCRVRIVEEFLHAFQQYYKDGTNGTVDCRWYAAYYILVNLGIYIIYSFTMSGIFYIHAILYFILIALVVLLVEPYKEEYAFYSIVDCVQYLLLAVFCSSIMFSNFTGLFQRKYMFYAYFVSTGTASIPFIYIAALVIYKIGKRSGLTFCKTESALNESLPHRLYNSNEYRDGCGYASPSIQDT